MVISLQYSEQWQTLVHRKEESVLMAREATLNDLIQELTSKYGQKFSRNLENTLFCHYDEYGRLKTISRNQKLQEGVCVQLHSLAYGG